MVCRSYEHLLLRAALDPHFGGKLAADPRATTLEAGYSPLFAESLVGLRAENLGAFAGALHRRIYGPQPLRADAVYRQAETERRPDAVYGAVGVMAERARRVSV